MESETEDTNTHGVDGEVGLPVELVDVLDVAEQGADLLRSQRQSSAVDDAAEVVLQRHRETSRGWKSRHKRLFINGL